MSATGEEMSSSGDVTTTDSVSSTGIVEVPRNIDFQMDANLKQVLFDKMSFNNMNGKLTVKDGKVDMKNLSMSTMGGNVVMNGYYSTADAKKPELKAGFKLTNIGFAQAYKELDLSLIHILYTKDTPSLTGAMVVLLSLTASGFGIPLSYLN